LDILLQQCLLMIQILLGTLCENGITLNHSCLNLKTNIIQIGSLGALVQGPYKTLIGGRVGHWNILS
jgi:hypothetical protein